MATTPSQVPVPSEKPQDLRFNAGKLDEFITSMGWTYTDRFGEKHYTIEGLRHYAEQVISTFGYVTMDSFEDGATLTLPNQVLRWKSNGEYYRWDGSFPKAVSASSTPSDSGGVGIGAWLSVGDATLRSMLRSDEGAANIGTEDGKTVQQHINDAKSEINDVKNDAHLIKSLHTNNHRYKVLYEIPLQFSSYSAVVNANGYDYLYASGHFIDHTASELWVFYPATGGDEAAWFVVYDLETLGEKTYFKAGMRWTKAFSLTYSGGSRYLYSRSISTLSLAKFDVTSLPSSGSTITETTPPRASVKYMHAGILGSEMLVPYDAPTTNSVAYSNTFNVLDKDTWAFKRSIRMDTVGAGNEYGINSYLYKNQGTVMTPNGIAMAFGTITKSTDTTSSENDLRIVQGVVLKTEEGVNLINGLFDPYKGMAVLNSSGYAASRFENEGLFYDEVNKRLSTIWHYTDVTTDVSGNFLIVEAFSGDTDVIDMKTAAVIPRPRLPDILSLYRSNFAVTLPSDPITGESLSDVTDIINMMIRYDLRGLEWYSSNFTTLTFNGATMAGSAPVRILRGTNTTFFLDTRNTGINQRWQITISGTTFTYTRVKMIATEYMFEGTNTGSFIGTGSPEGVVTASQGSIYHNRSGGSGTSVYFKESGTGNTGWVGK